MNDVLEVNEIQVSNLRLWVERYGADPRGDEVVLLHRSMGSRDAIDLVQRLATEHFRVSVIHLPGFGNSERPDWARSPRDLAIILTQFLNRSFEGPVHMIGLGLGGWVAAEIATMAEDHLKTLALVSPAGLLPRQGEIFDHMLVTIPVYLRRCCSDPLTYEKMYRDITTPEQIAEWELNREMTARIAWRPWYYSQQLPHLLTEFRKRAVVIWGDDDLVIPLECGRQYAELLTFGELHVVPGGGHHVEVEQPDAVASILSVTFAGAEELNRSA